MNLSLAGNIKQSTQSLGDSSKFKKDQVSGAEFDRSLEKIHEPRRYHAEKSPVSQSAKTESEKIVNRTSEVEPANNTQDKKLSRQTAMEIFLDRMQNELGISPDSILEAFGEMSELELSAQPEQTAASLIAKLGLDEKKSSQALDLYNQMLAITAAAGMSHYLVNNGQQAQITVMDKKESQLQSLRHSINDMSDRFFVTGQHAPMKMGIDQQAKIQQAYKAQTAISSAQSGANTQVDQESINQQQLVAASGMTEQIDGFSSLTNLAPQDAAQGFHASKGIDISGMSDIAQSDMAQLPTHAIEKLAKDVLAANQKLNSADLMAKNDPMAFEFAADSLVQPVETNQSLNLNELQSFKTETLNTAPIATGSALQDKNSNGEENAEGFESSNFNGHGAGAQHANAANKTNSSFVVPTPQPTHADSNNNVQELISKAQFLVQRGGGEMKITLSPEGLGDVNLRVQMVNGSVNVEMITNSQEAKKALENGLGELKDSLAAHKLNLESIKIDAGKETSSNLDQRGQDQERGHQQKFLGDFQQRNNNFRREMLELPGPNVPSSQTRDRAMNSKYDPNAKRKTESTRRLDLVA